MVLQGIDGLFSSARLIATWNATWTGATLYASSCVFSQAFPNMMISAISAVYSFILFERVSLLGHLQDPTSTARENLYVLIGRIAAYVLWIAPLITVGFILLQPDVEIAECSMKSLQDSGFLHLYMMIGSFAYSTVPLVFGFVLLLVASVAISAVKRKQEAEADHFTRFKLSEVINGLRVFITMNWIFTVHSTVFLLGELVFEWFVYMPEVVQESVKLFGASHSFLSSIVCFAFLHDRIRYPHDLLRPKPTEAQSGTRMHNSIKFDEHYAISFERFPNAHVTGLGMETLNYNPECGSRVRSPERRKTVSTTSYVIAVVQASTTCNKHQWTESVPYVTMNGAAIGGVIVVACVVFVNMVSVTDSFLALMIERTWALGNTDYSSWRNDKVTKGFTALTFVTIWIPLAAELSIDFFGSGGTVKDCSWEALIAESNSVWTTIMTFWWMIIGLLLFFVIAVAGTTFYRYRIFKSVILSKDARGLQWNRISSTIYPLITSTVFVFYSAAICFMIFHAGASNTMEGVIKIMHVALIIAVPVIILIARFKMMTKQDFSLRAFCKFSEGWGADLPEPVLTRVRRNQVSNHAKRMNLS
uniref:G_PROTEIN_RECEP_F1_2 domain-containing protein n=1 Tax=Steinernema glaseri TaxID=37863 RepID=A0A1I7ZQC6_9BILA